MKSILFAFIAITWSLCTTAQVKEGQVKYAIEMTSEDPNVQAQLAMLNGSKMDMVFSEKFSRVDFSMGMFMQMVTVTDLDANSGLLLMSGMIGKKAVTMTPEDVEKTAEETPEFQIEATKETKKILGYKCTKYILTTEEGTDVSYWTTTEINASKANNRYMNKSIEGFPLLFETETNGMKMTFTATEFKEGLKGLNTKELFDMSIPEGYEEMTMEELEGMGM